MKTSPLKSKSRLRKTSRDPRTTAKKAAWKPFSLFIRIRDKGICFTCGVQKPIKEMTAGHFRHSASKTYFNEKNNNCQCTRCNYFLSGNLGIYAQKLDEKYGSGTADKL